MKKRILGTTVLCATACLALAGCGQKGEEKETFVSLDINPAIELVVDENNVVVDAYATNTDAKVLFHGEKTLEGMKIDAAIGEIAKLSIDLGYLDEENKVIEYTMSSNLSSKKLGSLEASISGSFEKAALEANLEVKVDSKGTFTLERQLEHVKAKYPDNKDVQEMDEAKYKLVLAAMTSDFTLTFEEAVKLTPHELIDLIQEKRDEAFNIATEVYNKALGVADFTYGYARKAVERTAYTIACAVNKDKVNYGTIYSIYGSSADSLELIVETAYRVEKYEKEILSDEQVQAIVEEIKAAGLKLDEKLECLKDENGNITMASINAYLNKVFKNSDPEVQAAIENLTQSLNELEDSVNALVESIANEHKDEITAVVNSINDTIKSLKVLGYTLLPEEVKEVINAYCAELQVLVDTLKAGLNGEITLENVKEYVNNLRAEEAKALIKINESLTDEQKKIIADTLATMDEQCEAAKKVMEKALLSAKEASDKQLADMRAELLAK